MIIVTVARKPLQGTVVSNVLDYGTGGLNIDACRIGTSKEVPIGGPSTSRRIYSHLNENSEDAGGCNPNIGRWPANFILQHSKGCVCRGERQVKGNPSSKSYRESYDGVSVTRMLRGVSNPKNQHADAQGEETVRDWVCSPVSCPVWELQKVGLSRCGKENVKKESGKDKYGKSGTILGAESRPSGTIMVAYGDVGFVSRYFLQVQEL